MIVGVEARVALLADRGWARYTKEMLTALSSLDGIELRVLAPRNTIAEEFAERLGRRSNVRFHFTPFEPGSPDEYWSSPERARPAESWLGRVDLLHSMTRFSPPTGIRPVVVTVHDIAPLSDPPFKPEYRAATLKALETLQEDRYSVIAVSEYTKKELIGRGGIRFDKAVVVPEGVNDIFRPRERDSLEKKRPRPVNEYVLYVGGAGLNKNLHRFLAAALELHRWRGTSLVIVGDHAWGYDALPSEKLRSGWVHFKSRVDDRELAHIYQEAAALVLPSLHEGFGLPIVEAMACGTPVACSRIPVFEEVGEDAVLYFDPHATEDMIDCILRLLTDAELARMLRSRGLKRASRHSWEAAARRTVEVYSHALAREGRQGTDVP